jgi:hypothetical protein
LEKGFMIGKKAIIFHAAYICSFASYFAPPHQPHQGGKDAYDASQESWTKATGKLDRVCVAHMFISSRPGLLLPPLQKN